MRSILTISWLALKESLKGRIFYIVIVFLCFFLLLSLYISSLSLGNVSRVMENSGMFGITLICLLVTVLFGVFSLYQKQERNELYVLLNKVSRSHYLLGCFLGCSYVLMIFSFLMGLGIFFLIWVTCGKISFGLFIAIIMAVLEFSLLIGFGIFFYTLGVSYFFNSFLTLGIFVLGHSFEEAILSFIALGRYASLLHFKFIKIVSYLLPNFDVFNFRLAIVHSETIPPGEFLLAIGYWFFYLSAVLSGASIVISKRDL